MKTIKLEILKRNRQYFACKTWDNPKVRLRITPESEHLTVGTHLLDVVDISTETAYGRDVVYAVYNPAVGEEIKMEHRVNNVYLTDECKKIKGVLNDDRTEWTFSSAYASEVSKINAKYNTNLVTVDIKSIYDILHSYKGLVVCGYQLFCIDANNGEPILSPNVALVFGTFNEGARRCKTLLNAGSVFRMQMPQEMLDEYEDSEHCFEITISA